MAFIDQKARGIFVAGKARVSGFSGQKSQKVSELILIKEQGRK